jgi:hypothetical protein
MTDTPITPDEQETSHQQAPTGYVEQARFTGMVQKVEQLTLANRGLTDQLALKSSEIEQLKAQLSLKDTEKTVAISERDKQLQSAVQTASAAEAELNTLRALKLKVETAKKLNRPDLLRIIDSIPNLTDGEALETVLKEFAGFADAAATEREKQLLAGSTPGSSSLQTKIASTPANEADWNRHIESLPLGSAERSKAWDDYYKFLESKNK